MKNLFHNIFMFWWSVRRKYDIIKIDQQQSERDVRLGINSILMSIIGTAAVIAFAYFAYKCFTWNSDAASSGIGAVAGGLFIYLGGAVCVLISISSYTSLVLASIVYAAYQMKLNKKKIGLAALIISIILSVGTIIALVVLILLSGSANS